MNNSEDINNLVDFTNEVYDKLFSEVKLSQYIVCDDLTMLSDTQLENALTGIPFELFKCAKLISDVTLKRDAEKACASRYRGEDKLSTEAIEHATMQMVYTAALNRINSEVSAAKEYLMAVKKLWDRRRSFDKVPIAEKDYKLPEYQFDNKTYIK